MSIQLGARTEDHVRKFWQMTQDEEIQEMFPFSVSSLEESLDLYEASKAPGARSFGQIILVDGHYIGDIWCYCIDEEDEYSAMLSIVIFDKTYWGQGIGSEAIKIFAETVFAKYKIKSLGAFTYDRNKRSIHALEKAGFKMVESFEEKGIMSWYMALHPKTKSFL